MEHSVNEGAVENVASAGRVPNCNVEGRGTQDAVSVQEYRSRMPSVIPVMACGKRAASSLTASSSSSYPVRSAAKSSADQVIHPGQEFVRRRVVYLVDIDHDRNAGLPRPPGCLERGPTVAPVQMQIRRP